MTRFAVPFAKALAVFVREAAIQPGRGTSAQETDPEFVEVTDEIVFQAVADRMRRLMREQGVSQAELAVKSGVSVGVVARALRDPNRAKLANLQKIAAALDTRFADLL
jgi:ribosome-binding protein aMBF1 (putative translation factor)